jgi:hypothetical protein
MHDALTELDYILQDQIAAIANAAEDAYECPIFLSGASVFEFAAAGKSLIAVSGNTRSCPSAMLVTRY